MQFYPFKLKSFAQVVKNRVVIVHYEFCNDN